MFVSSILKGLDKRLFLSYRYECRRGEACEVLVQNKLVIRSCKRRRVVIDIQHSDNESCRSAVAFAIPVGRHYVQLEL